MPTPEEQVQFLWNIQRLLAEGLFVASYKFALVHALADLAVLKGDDSGAPLEIETKDIAAKFVELYWRQSRPFPVGGEATLGCGDGPASYNTRATPPSPATRSTPSSQPRSSSGSPAPHPAGQPASKSGAESRRRLVAKSHQVSP
jgi:hypothetical protein